MHRLTRRFALLLAAFGITSVLATGVAHAGSGKPRDPQARLDRKCERLGCTAAQKTQIKAIHAAAAPQIDAARAALRGLRDQQRAEWQKAQPDARALDRLDAQIDAQRDTISDLRRAAKLKVHALLTPEQRAKIGQHRGGKGPRAKARPAR